MLNFICPVCKSEISLLERTYKCPNNHCFDLSKDGYVNLLMSQQSSLKRHGDDKLMVKARREFLEKGFYNELRQTLCDTLKEALSENSTIVDVGCGEGYYTSEISKVNNFEIFGIDISKDALKYAAKSVKSSSFAVASAFSLPFAETPAGVEKLMQKLNETQYQLNGLKLELLKRDIDETSCNFVFVDSADLLKDAVNLLAKNHSGLCGAFFGNENDGYRFNIITPDIEETRQLLKKKLNAQGGGRDNMLQGKTDAKKEEIIAFFN